MIPQRIYAGPAIPEAHDPSWQVYTNLTPEQVRAFQSFPQDLAAYVRQKRWMTEIATVTLPDMPSNPNLNGVQISMQADSRSKIAELKQAIDNGAMPADTVVPFLAVDRVAMLTVDDVNVLYKYVVGYVLGTYSVAADLLAQVNATPQGITGRAAIDAALSQSAVQAAMRSATQAGARK